MLTNDIKELHQASMLGINCNCVIGHHENGSVHGVGGRMCEWIIINS